MYPLKFYSSVYATSCFYARSTVENDEENDASLDALLEGGYFPRGDEHLDFDGILDSSLQFSWSIPSREGKVVQLY